jgi:hypothetical protein
MWEKAQHAAEKAMQHLWLAFTNTSHTELLEVSSYNNSWIHYVAQ